MMTDSDLDTFGKGVVGGVVLSLLTAAIVIHLHLSGLEICRDTHGPDTTTHNGKCVKAVPFEKEEEKDD